MLRNLHSLLFSLSFELLSRGAAVQAEEFVVGNVAAAVRLPARMCATPTSLRKGAQSCDIGQDIMDAVVTRYQ